MRKKKQANVLEQDFDAKPVVSAVTGAAKTFARVVFPTEQIKAERAKKKLKELKARIRAKKAELEYKSKLKELEELENS